MSDQISAYTLNVSIHDMKPQFYWRPYNNVISVSEVLSSDEDEIDDTNQEYLEKLQEKVTKGRAGSPFNITAYIQVWSGIAFFEEKLLSRLLQTVFIPYAGLRANAHTSAW